MKNWLNKTKKWGRIDFIEIPVRFGDRNKEFIGYDFKKKVFFTIFFTNKYREDKLDAQQRLKRLESEMKEWGKGLNDIGIYNTKKQYAEVKHQIDFIKKYLWQNSQLKYQRRDEC